MIDVFILEDSESFKQILTLCLKNWRKDIKLSICSSIEEASSLLKTKKTPFTLAILDHNLPDGQSSELFDNSIIKESTVLTLSSDPSPSVPVESIKAGAMYFLDKRHVSTPLFLPLLEALIERKELEKRLLQVKLQESSLKTINTLIATLEHEINNPLGAVLGGVYLLKQKITSLDKDQKEAIRLVEESGQRIKHVIKQLREASNLETVSKAKEELYHIPGDTPWEKKKS